ncbi:MAG: hypothetical protein WD003_01425 [Candidatus Paceibacterota bacterium]
MKSPFFIFLFFLLLLIAGLHITGIELFWYWRFSFFDILVHTLSGMWISGMVVWFFSLSPYGRGQEKSRGRVFLIALLVTLGIGLAWEVFEIAVGATFIWYEHYLLDTILDVLADMMGAFLIFLYFSLNISKKQ